MNVVGSANMGAKRISGYLAPHTRRATGAGVRQDPVEWRRRGDGKSLTAHEMETSDGRRMGGALCRPGPVAREGKVWKRGVSDPLLDLALFISARPQGVAHAPLSEQILPEDLAQCLARGGTTGSPYLRARRAGVGAGMSAHRVDPRCFGRNVSWH